MTTLREAAEQALEALEDMLGWGSLAPQSVQASSKQSLQRLREALAQPESEPVVWQFRMRPDWVLDKDFWEPWTNCTKEQAADYQRVPHLHDWTYESRALFTHPPQRKPLTDDEVRKLWDSHTIEVYGKIGINPVLFARYLEREYGIGEKNDL